MDYLNKNLYELPANARYNDKEKIAPFLFNIDNDNKNNSALMNNVNVKKDDEVGDHTDKYQEYQEYQQFNMPWSSNSDIRLEEPDKLPDPHPIIDNVICPKCGNTQANWWMVQTDSADEPSTQFFRCTKCRHTWRNTRSS